jgi:hypothetical protein
LRSKKVAVGLTWIYISIVRNSVIVPVVRIDALIVALDKIGAGYIVAIREKFELSGEKKLKSGCLWLLV